MARAMQRRCCWPPERAGALEGGLDALLDLLAAELEVQAQGIGDVVEDAHREGGGLLEDHAHATAKGEEVGLGVKNVLAIEKDLTLGALAAMEGVDAVVGAQVGGFAAAGGTDDGGNLALGDVPS